MKSWTKEIEINVAIDQVWELLNGNLEDLQKIMPQVVANDPVKLTPEKIGSIYLQKYREGKRIQEYEVKTLEYSDEIHFKKLKVGFTLANMFDITAKYELKVIDSDTTLFKYTASNAPLKWYLKPLVLLGSDKIVIQFVQRVKEVAEASKISSGQF